MPYKTNNSEVEHTEKRREADQGVAAAETDAHTLPEVLTRPAWDNSTAIIKRLHQHMVAQGWAGEPTQELLVYEPADPLPRRLTERNRPLTVMIWRTQQGEIVTYGDAVALGIVEHADAVGRIVAQAADGRIQCILVHCNGCQPGVLVTVTEEQLLVRMSRASWRRVVCAW
jgi:hypothetical protein